MNIPDDKELTGLGREALLLLVKQLRDAVMGYEHSISWHTDCLQCPKLMDQIYELDQHTVPALKATLEASQILNEHHKTQTARLRIAVEGLEEIQRKSHFAGPVIASETLAKLRLP